MNEKLENKLEALYEDMGSISKMLNMKQFLTEIVGRPERSGRTWFSQRVKREKRKNGGQYRFSDDNWLQLQAALSVYSKKLSDTSMRIRFYLEEKSHEERFKDL